MANFTKHRFCSEEFFALISHKNTIRHGTADGHKVLNGITGDLRLSSSLSWRSLRITRLLQFATLTLTLHQHSSSMFWKFLTFRKHLFPSGSSLRHRRIHAASQLHNLLWSSNTSCGSTLTTLTTQLNHTAEIVVNPYPSYPSSCRKLFSVSLTESWAFSIPVSFHSILLWA